MTGKTKFSWLILVTLLLSLLLGACGENPTATTAAATTGVATTAAPATTTTIAATPTIVAPTPTLAPTVGGPTVPPTFTAAPTVAAAPANIDWVSNGVCYEIFVRSFFDSNGDGIGDFKGMTAKLDYLNDGNPNSNKSMGVNCVWLMPIMASPSYHGYDQTDYYTVNPQYGTNDDFKTFTQEAKKRGIRVIIDLVINHTSREHAWFKAAGSDPNSPYRNWYIFSDTNPGYASPNGGPAWHRNPYGAGFYYAAFDSSQPDLNLRNPDVNKEINKITEFWLKEMGVDGFRMDAVKHLIENGQVQVNTRETQAWLRDYRKFYKSVKPDSFVIGEIFGSSSELAGYYPDGLDHFFDFTTAQGIVNSARQGNTGFVNLALDSFSKLPFQRYGSFLTNHDQNRVFSTLRTDVGSMKMAATALLTLPGLPFMYYGEEIGMSGFKPDPELRTPMQWTGDAATGGFTTGKPWQALNADTPKFNVAAQESDPASLLNVYRALVKARRTTPALASGNLLPVSASEGGVATYLRRLGDSTALVMLNMRDEPAKGVKLSAENTGLAAGQYTVTTLLGVGVANATPPTITVGANGEIVNYAPLGEMPPHSALILTLKK
jgi:alpha-amylase